MGIEVKATVREDLGVRLQTAVRSGLLEAGKEILAVSDVLAPREPVARHGVHLDETGFVRVEPGADVDSVAVGYTAFWAIWQEEDLTYHHPHGGTAKFLERALAGGVEVAGETIAVAVRKALAE